MDALRERPGDVLARADVGFWEGMYEREWLSFYAFALSERGYHVFVSHTQGVASLALGATLGFQPALGDASLALGTSYFLNIAILQASYSYVPENPYRTDGADRSGQD